MIIYISVYIIGKELFWFRENNYMKKKIIICLMKYCRFIQGYENMEYF